MKNKLWIFFIIILLIVIGLAFYFFTNQFSNDNSNYNASRTTQDNTSNSFINTNNQPTSKSSSSQNKASIEEQIATFTTKIYTKDEARQNNINITCSTLNNTIVSNGSEFSFCNTVGQATSEKGYQKADIFDKYGNKKKGLGGGNCQISTTLYNTVLAVPELTITERHEHSNKVPYVQNGLDAAVAYGSYDFKFINNTGYNLKITAASDGDTVTTSIFRVK